MAEITAAMVKQLRERSGAGMMDAKKALKETDGDFEVAIDWLRTKGLSKAAKKAGRVAAEGLVAVASESRGAGMAAAVLEVNSETDFVARNALFQEFAAECAALALTVEGDLDALKAAPSRAGKPVSDALTDLIAQIGENMSLRRTRVLAVEPGVVASYIHGGVTEQAGRLGVLLGLKSEGDADALATLGRKLAMHVAASNPLAANVDELDPAVVERERAVFADQARASGKPEAIIEKMVEGRLRKFYEESVFVKQAFVMDPDRSVEKVISDAASEVGAPIELVGFVRFALGEGIEKEDGDFAAEVAAAAKRD